MAATTELFQMEILLGLSLELRITDSPLVLSVGFETVGKASPGSDVQDYLRKISARQPGRPHFTITGDFPKIVEVLKALGVVRLDGEVRFVNMSTMARFDAEGRIVQLKSDDGWIDI